MQSEFEAIGELRSGALMLIITLVLVFIATITVLAYFALESELFSPFLHISQLSLYFGDIMAITFTGALLAIPGYWNLREGFKTLANLRYTGATLFFISLGLIIPAEIIAYKRL